MPRFAAPRSSPRSARSTFVWLADGMMADHLPAPEHALEDPNGLLALGGDLHPATLLDAYSRGIFPWFNDDEAILWWSPDPRCVLFPREVKVSRSLRKKFSAGHFQVRADESFQTVIEACAQPRSYVRETWITDLIKQAYCELHRRGYAHSIEVYRNADLVGGLYGVAFGSVFFGESMFHRETDASKIALVTLCRQLERWGFDLVDCQVSSDHLKNMGAVDIDRPQFLRLLNCATSQSRTPGRWTLDDDL